MFDCSSTEVKIDEDDRSETILLLFFITPDTAHKYNENITAKNTKHGS